MKTSKGNNRWHLYAIEREASSQRCLCRSARAFCPPIRRRSLLRGLLCSSTLKSCAASVSQLDFLRRGFPADDMSAWRSPDGDGHCEILRDLETRKRFELPAKTHLRCHSCTVPQGFVGDWRFDCLSVFHNSSRTKISCCTICSIVTRSSHGSCVRQRCSTVRRYCHSGKGCDRACSLDVLERGKDIG